MGQVNPIFKKRTVSFSLVDGRVARCPVKDLEIMAFFRNFFRDNEIPWAIELFYSNFGAKNS